MSRIGLRYNIIQPMRQCFNCKHWKAATKISPFLFEFAESGHCTAGYCKKQIRRKPDRRHALK